MQGGEKQTNPWDSGDLERVGSVTVEGLLIRDWHIALKLTLIPENLDHCLAMLDSGVHLASNMPMDERVGNNV